MPTTPPNPTVPPIAVPIGRGHLMDAAKRAPVAKKKTKVKAKKPSKKKGKK